MSEAIRDVTVRVNVEGGKIGKMPDFDKLTIAAESFYNTVDEGTRLLTSSMGDVRTATTAVIDEFASIADIEIPSDGFDDLTAAAEAFGTTAEDGIEAAVTATENLAESMQTVVTATETAAEATVAATTEIATATQAEGKTASEIMFAKIRMSERLAAFNRKAADESKKQAKETAAEAKKSGEEAQRQMFAAGGALAQSLAAGTQFISTLRLIGGESKEIEELARTFAQVQGVVQGIAAGTQSFNALNQGLSALQASAAAASLQIAGTGVAATATQGALIRLAPAAAVAQAALGPIALAVAGIALAVTAVMAVSNYFAEDIPDDADKTTRAYEKTTDQLERMKRQLDANINSIKNQNAMLRTELDLRNALDGKGDTAPRIEEKREADVKTATDDANAKIAADRAAAKKNMAALEKERADLAEENVRLKRDGQSTTITGQRVFDPVMAAQHKANNDRIWNLDEQISQQRQASTAGEGITLTTETQDEFAASIAELPEEIQAGFMETLAEFASATASANQDALSSYESAAKDNEAAIKENTAKQKELTDAYNTERDTALDLQQDPTQLNEITTNINTAASTGNLNAGIDALGGVISSDKESELRGLLAEGNLTRERLLAELADASEFETEKAILQKQIDEQKAMAQVLLNTKEQLAKAMEEAKNAGQALYEEIANTQAASQQR